MAKALTEYTSNMSDIERVNCVLKFVQSIEYQYDDDGTGQNDYFKYPAETLWDQKGDCEDHAILFASLIEAMGYDVVLHYVYCYKNGVFYAAHMAAGVNVSGASGSYVTLNGSNYYYCEATASAGTDTNSWANVGYIPSGYQIIRTYDV